MLHVKTGKEWQERNCNLQLLWLSTAPVWPLGSLPRPSFSLFQVQPAAKLRTWFRETQAETDHCLWEIQAHQCRHSNSILQICKHVCICGFFWVPGIVLASSQHPCPSVLYHTHRRERYISRGRVKRRFHEKNKNMSGCDVHLQSSAKQDSNWPHFTHYQPFNTFLYLCTFFVPPFPLSTPMILQNSAVSAPSQSGAPWLSVLLVTKFILSGCVHPFCDVLTH